MAQNKVRGSTQLTATLDQLGDVSVAGASTDQILGYNGTTSQWNPVTVATSGGSGLKYYALVTFNPTGWSYTYASTTMKAIDFSEAQYQTGGTWWSDGGLLGDEGEQLVIPVSGIARFVARMGWAISGPPVPAPALVLELRCDGNRVWPQTGVTYSTDLYFNAYSQVGTPVSDDVLEMDTGWIPMTGGQIVKLLVGRSTEGSAYPVQVSLSAELIPT